MSSPGPSESDRSLYRRLRYWVVGMSGTLFTFLAMGLLLLAALYLYTQKVSSQLEQSEGVGSAVPDLKLEPLVGEAKPLTLADLKGKVVLVDFWGPWCPACCIELPHLADLAQEFAGEADFLFLPVTCDNSYPGNLDELRDSTEQFLQRESLTLPVYSDPQAVTGRAFVEVSPFSGLPTLFLLDRDGVIRAVWHGYSPGLMVAVRQRVRQLLDGSPEPKDASPKR